MSDLQKKILISEEILHKISEDIFEEILQVRKRGLQDGESAEVG